MVKRNHKVIHVVYEIVSGVGRCQFFPLLNDVIWGRHCIVAEREAALLRAGSARVDPPARLKTTQSTRT